MSDPLRTDVSRAQEPAADSERDAKIERLLLAGLDHYFAGEYERAIEVWSRVYFLDRSHARARAYIERARSAQSERQRESEELLQHGVAAFRRGDGEEARRLLGAAITHGAPQDEALAVLDRLNRIEQGSKGHLSFARTSAVPPNAGSLSAAATSMRSRAALTLVVLAVIALAGAGLRWSSLVGGEGSSTSLAPVPSTGLPLPRRGETAIARARELMSSGRLRDALRELELVRFTDPQRQMADRLRADIQKQLLAIASTPSSVPQGRSGLP